LAIILIVAKIPAPSNNARTTQTIFAPSRLLIALKNISVILIPKAIRPNANPPTSLTNC